MTYHPFIFRMPENTPDLDFVTLRARLEAEHGGEELSWGDSFSIGSTVVIRWNDATGGFPSAEFVLYGLHIARISASEVQFTDVDDPHRATTEWVIKIIRDNALGGGAGRIPRLKADGEGPWTARGQAGLLCIGYDRDRPVWGRTYPVSQDAIAEQRRKHAAWKAEWAARREQDAAESRRREALKTYTGPEGSAYASDADSTEYNWRVIDTTFRDGGADYSTIGYVRDTRDNGNAHAGYLGHLIHGSPEAAAGPLSAPFRAVSLDGELIGAHHELKDALAAVLRRKASRKPMPAGSAEVITVTEPPWHGVPFPDDTIDAARADWAAALPDTLRDLRED